MRLASNTQRVAYLEEAPSIRAALELLSDKEPEAEAQGTLIAVEADKLKSLVWSWNGPFRFSLGAFLGGFQFESALAAGGRFEGRQGLFYVALLFRTCEHLGNDFMADAVLDGLGVMAWAVFILLAEVRL